MQRIPAGDGLVQLKGRCAVTGEEHVTPPISEEALKRYEAGEHAQLAFPELPIEEREFLISGTSPEGWRIIFPPVPGEGAMNKWAAEVEDA